MRKSNELIDEMLGCKIQLAGAITMKFVDGKSTYVEDMNDKTISRWMALMVGEQLIADTCGDNPKCVNVKTKHLLDYVNARSVDMFHILQDMKR